MPPLRKTFGGFVFRLLGFFLFLCSGVHASVLDWFHPLSEEAKRAQMLLEGFDPIVESALKEYNVPGIAVGVVVDGELIYAKGFGFRDVEKKLPVTPKTLFRIGSCTKAFTSFVMGTLVEEGVTYWDQPVIDILPEFRLYDQYATQNLTMRDLLTHRSGMPRHDFMWYNSKMTRAEVMRKLRYLEPSCDLRERYQYGNLMYLVAGYAMEQLTNQSWEALVSERILKPLEMNHTNFSVEELLKQRDFASPYIEKEGQLHRMSFRDFSLIGPGGSMNSTVEDLSQWVKMQLAQGSFKDKVLISPSILQEMHTSQVAVPGNPEIKEVLLYAYGIGWGISSYRGHYLLSHDGALDGFTSLVALLPQEKTGVIVLANTNLTSLPRFLSLQLIDRVLELPFIDWVQKGSDGLAKSKQSAKERKHTEDVLRKKGTSPSHPLEDFVGKYEHPGYGTFTIALKDGKLEGTFNGITLLLDHWHYDVFVVREEAQDTFISREGTKITFRNNIQGEIDEVIIPLEPQANDIVFVRKADSQHSSVEYLRKFVGLYEIYGMTVELAVRNQTLCALIPGQPIYQLEPTGADNEFTVKSITGYSVRFVIGPTGQIEELLLVQPYGAFSARPKK